MPVSLQYFLIPDSQALFVAKDRADAVNPSFVRLLSECREHCSLELVIPETVRGEIIYQKVSQALVTAKRARDSLDTLGALAGQIKVKVPSDVAIRKNVERKFDRWLRENKATIAPNVFKKLIWSGIINDAIWRLPPFEPSEDGKHEKGFRDALIKASVINFAKANSAVTCAFVSDDQLLTVALESERLGNLRIFESAKSFLGHVSLVRAKIDQEQAVALQTNAQKKFYEDANPSCIYARDRIVQRIREQYSASLARPHLPSDGLGLASLLGGLSTEISWEQFGQDKIYLHGTAFSRCPKPSIFEWKSRLQFVGLFYVPSNRFMNPQMRKSMFEITWTSHIIASDIADSALVDSNPIALIENTFLITNETEAKKYGFELPQTPPYSWPAALGDIATAIQNVSTANLKIK